MARARAGAPPGQDVRAPSSRTTTVTDAGETRGGRDFVLVTEQDEPAPPTTAPPTGDPTTAPGAGGSDDDDSDDDGTPVEASDALPDTGGRCGLVGVAGVSLVLAGGATIGVGARRRRRDG